MSRIWTPAVRSGRRSATAGLQGRTADQDVAAVATKYACSVCQITYYVPIKQKAHCPLCDAARRVTELQAAMTVVRNQLALREAEFVRLQTTVDLTQAMRNALDIAGEDDLTFLKSVLYRFRDDKASIGLRVTHGGRATVRATSAPVNGFLALPRGLEPEAHICTSIGGVAIAGYFDEAVRTAGTPFAMTVLIRALGLKLAEAP